MHTMTKLTIGCALLSAFILGINLGCGDQPKPEQIIKTHIKYINRDVEHTVNRATFLPIKGNRADFIAQQYILAAALPAHVLQPVRGK